MGRDSVADRGAATIDLWGSRDSALTPLDAIFPTRLLYCLGGRGGSFSLLSFVPIRSGGVLEPAQTGLQEPVTKFSGVP